MRITAIATTSFVHDRLHAIEGHQIVIEESLAHELERRGLVRVLPRRVDMALMRPTGAAIAGKAKDDGQGQPSSSPPPAPHLLRPILHLPNRGRGKSQKRGR